MRSALPSLAPALALRFSSADRTLDRGDRREVGSRLIRGCLLRSREDALRKVVAAHLIAAPLLSLSKSREPKHQRHSTSATVSDDDMVLAEAEAAAASEPAPEAVADPAAAADGVVTGSPEKRERRKQRRRTP
jgi:hypothetical protein